MSETQNEAPAQVVIVGGGVIGLATAWRTLGRGLTVTVIDPFPAGAGAQARADAGAAASAEVGAGQASRVAAGMLPAGNEMMYDNSDLMNLCLASRAFYPSFTAELEADAGLPAGYRRDGLLEIAYGDVDVAVLNRILNFVEPLGVKVEQLTASQCLELEPELAPEVQAGLYAPEDGSVDPRQLTAALVAGIERLGGTVLRASATEVLIDGDRATGVRLADGRVVSGEQIVLAAGCWTNQLKGIPAGVVPEVRPVKGEVLRLRSERPFLRRTIRGLVDGSSVYLVPRADGELVIGATYLDRGYDTTVTAGGLAQLLRRASTLLPGIGDLEFAEFSAGLRPTTVDELPVLGATRVPGLLLATGHSRIGIQLAPISGDIMAQILATGEAPELAASFSPLRFS
jgi:glycine oxidase